MQEACRLEEIVEEARRAVQVTREGIPEIKGDTRVVEKLKECFISEIVGHVLPEAQEWLNQVRTSVSRLVSLLGLKGFTYPREFGSFVADPIAHLKKKLFNYVYDLIRGRMSLEEFYQRAGAALRTSLRTNMRMAYQIWGLTTIMAHLASDGFTLVYPEHGFLNFDRSGKQKLGIIPPNAILFSLERGFISLFHEAPRPLGWEDTSDLQRVWKLYTALRPDAMIYRGAVFNMVDLNSSPPIRRPNLILEFKELEDWYLRARDLKGYFRKPLTAEEWRSKWLEGLFEGLAEVMGVSKLEARKSVVEGATLRVKEYQLVKLYRATYRPDKMILVSRTKLPNDVRKSLEDDGIEVVDGVGFNGEALRGVAETIKEMAAFEGGNIHVTLTPETCELLARAMRVLGEVNPDRVIREALRRLLGS